MAKRVNMRGQNRVFNMSATCSVSKHRTATHIHFPRASMVGLGLTTRQRTSDTRHISQDTDHPTRFQLPCDHKAKVTCTLVHIMYYCNYRNTDMTMYLGQGNNFGILVDLLTSDHLGHSCSLPTSLTSRTLSSQAVNSA